MPSASVYAQPRVIRHLKDCKFYHTVDIPGYGCLKGGIDLRRSARDYLGHVEVRGKRVLEIGTASGFLCFYMERQGAEVIAYDLAEDQSWDMVPFARCDSPRRVAARNAVMRKFRNAFWFCHRAFHSRAKMVYGTAYAVPEAIGPVEITTFGSVLIHLRDPFLALQSALRLTRETVIITNPIVPHRRQLQLLGRFVGPYMLFLPRPQACEPLDTWWELTPETVQRFLEVLGFEKTRVTYHTQKLSGRPQPFYTLVGWRTRRTYHAGL